jgi:RNA polymerase sigma-70 factor (ECF subfamily)
MQPSTTKEDVLGKLRQTSDAELVQLIHESPPAAAESREAIGILYDRYQEHVFRYLWVRSSSSQQAEDLTGEVFTRMVAFLPRYR